MTIRGKDDIRSICEALGFILDLDNWEKKDFMRFILRDGLEASDSAFTLIWYKEESFYTNLRSAAKVLFKAGQQRKIEQFTKLIDL